MINKTVLISAAGGSLFPYILKLLGGNYRLILTDVLEAIGRLYPDQLFLKVPKAGSMEFKTEVKKIIVDYKVDYYIPLIDQEISKVLEIGREVKSLRVISPNLEFVNLCLDKYRLMKVLKESKISQIKTCLGNDFKEDFGFPVFIKPIASTGSRGTWRVDNIDQFEAYFKLEEFKKDQVLVQEFLAGQEYTVSVTVNNLNSLMAIVPKKIITKKGITIHALTQRNQAVANACRKIVDQFHPSGPFNVQLMLVGDEVKIFEINPRFSTTSILTCEAGIDEFGMCIENYGKENIVQTDNFKENIYLYRRWENLFYK